MEDADTGKAVFPNVIFLKENPTSENVARWLFYKIRDAIKNVTKCSSEHTTNGTHRIVQVERIKLHETGSSWAEYRE
jgi:6-pyruvoyl-tetrahydropterin synthase